MTMLGPRTKVASPGEASSRDLAALLPRLREAGVSHILTVDSIESIELQLQEVVQPAGLRPLTI